MILKRLLPQSSEQKRSYQITRFHILEDHDLNIHFLITSNLTYPTFMLFNYAYRTSEFATSLLHLKSRLI
jgi:hypothetical protein